MTTDTVTVYQPSRLQLVKYLHNLKDPVPEHDFVNPPTDTSDEQRLFSSTGGILKQIAHARDNNQFVEDNVVAYYLFERRGTKSTSGLDLDGKTVVFNQNLKVVQPDNTSFQVNKHTRGKVIVDENDVIAMLLDTGKHLTLTNFAKDSPQALVYFLSNLTVLD